MSSLDGYVGRVNAFEITKVIYRDLNHNEICLKWWNFIILKLREPKLKKWKPQGPNLQLSQNKIWLRKDVAPMSLLEVEICIFGGLYRELKSVNPNDSWLLLKLGSRRVVFSPSSWLYLLYYQSLLLIPSCFGL